MSPDWLASPVKPLDQAATAAALSRQGQLTKPPGSLGALEDIAVRLAGMQGREKPELERVRIVVFAADHGVAAEGVSAFPQAVTGQMILNFAHGGAAISVLAKEQGAELEVVDVGSVAELPPLPEVRVQKAGQGTANFRRGPAMTEAQLESALQAGRNAAERALAAGAQLFIGGEMGIANTSAATAIACALLNLEPEALAGPGTGLDAAGVRHKAQVIRESLTLHWETLSSPLAVLRQVGGFEIAALCGAYLSCAQAGLPVLVDGFIASSAALLALRIQPEVAGWRKPCSWCLHYSG